MARPRNPVPSYRRHKQSGQAIVTVRTPGGGRRDMLLGPYDSPESHAEYRRVLAEIQTPAGRPVAAAPESVTVNEVLLAFLKWAVVHYRTPAGGETTEVNEVRRSLALVKDLYGHTPGREFGPKALASVRRKMIAAGWCRTLVNKRVDRVKRCFKWAAAEELVPVAVFQALATVPGLRKGRTEARESEPVKPVDPARVAATLPFLNRHVRAMVELQRYTGMRPGEVCRLRLDQVDREGDVWLFRPGAHKTAHRGKARVIPLGPKARAVLEDFLTGSVARPDPAAPVFSPAVEKQERLRVWRANRKSKVPPSQQNRKKSHPRRVPGGRWHPHAYATAVRRACKRAGVPHWHPNQLRHTFGTEVRKAYGLEAAQVLLGHARADVTQVYADRDLGLAVSVAAEVG